MTGRDWVPIRLLLSLIGSLDLGVMADWPPSLGWARHLIGSSRRALRLIRSLLLEVTL